MFYESFPFNFLNGILCAENKFKFTDRLVNRPALWCPPPQNWVKLNVDGSRNSLGRIAAGGAIRDSNGQWLGGFTVNKGTGSALDSEVWGMVEGLLYAWQDGYKFLLVETDCFTVFEVLGQETKECHPLFNLLQKCKSIIHGDWVCKIVHTHRDANKLAD
ncbi:hypothetical protein ACOSQ2_026075 [Xanthoceras sorbifolium]